MRDEDAFNAWLSSQLGKLKPSVLGRKVAEKYHIGVPDFYLIKGGQIAFVESKIMRVRPAGKHKVLNRPFTGPQLTFLSEAELAGAKCYGLVALDWARSMVVIPQSAIPTTGNWKGAEWIAQPACVRRFGFDEVPRMVAHLFGINIPAPDQVITESWEVAES